MCQVMNSSLHKSRNLLRRKDVMSYLNSSFAGRRLVATGAFPSKTSSIFTARNCSCSTLRSTVAINPVVTHARHFSLFNSNETVFALSSGHGKCGTHFYISLSTC